MNLTLGNFSVGGVFEYFNDFNDQGPNNIDMWTTGVGVGYTMDAFTVGAQYSHGDADDDGSDGGSSTQDRIVLTGNYAMGPGINLDAELGYTWTDENGNGAVFTSDDGGVEDGVVGDDGVEGDGRLGCGCGRHRRGRLRG